MYVMRTLTERSEGKFRITYIMWTSSERSEREFHIIIGLNKGEALHALARQLFFGRLGELRDRAFEDQMHRASCLHLLMAAIAAWNTVYLTKAIATLRKRGEDIPEATVSSYSMVPAESSISCIYVPLSSSFLIWSYLSSEAEFWIRFKKTNDSVC